jgi:hydrogenase maturation protease
MKVLIYGYGNPGRMDDGLGNAFVARMEEWTEKLEAFTFYFDSNYQLNIEDADAIADKDFVLFVDASTEEIEDFCVTKVDESSKVAFTTHAATPGYIVDLCKKINGSAPPTYLLHIKGYEWDFREGLTDKALKNLEKALVYFKGKFLDREQLTKPEFIEKKCN